MDQARVARALDDDQVAGLDSLPIEELRHRKGECTALETATSYLRRLAQGRLDIVADEQRRRVSGEAPVEHEGLVESLTGILSERSRTPGATRLPAAMVPDEAEADTTELDAIAGPGTLSGLGDLDEAELVSLVDRLSAYEATLSALRSSLFERIDAFQGELVRRYKTGEAKVDTLLE